MFRSRSVLPPADCPELLSNRDGLSCLRFAVRVCKAKRHAQLGTALAECKNDVSWNRPLTDNLNDLVSSLPPLPTEQLLMDQLPDWGGERAIVISPGRAQLAKHLIQNQGVREASAWFVDLHSAQLAETYDDSVEVICSADLPPKEYDLVAMPVLARGEAELTRDLLQQGHDRLIAGGYLAVSVDNPRDQWLHEQMQVLLDKVTCRRVAQGCVYWGRKNKPLKKVRDFTCRFSYRDDQDRLIDAFSRPGVFSHRRLDPGARQLMLSADVGSEDNVLDMGCGAGTVALACALKTSGTVYAVDSNARAIECLSRGAEQNGLSNIQPIWNADGELELPQPVDLALANPPYFGDDTISKHFVDTSIASLRSGGALLVVTKRPSWYEEYFTPILEDVVVFESSRYYVACGRKP